MKSKHTVCLIVFFAMLIMLNSGCGKSPVEVIAMVPTEQIDAALYDSSNESAVVQSVSLSIGSTQQTTEEILTQQMTQIVTREVNSVVQLSEKKLRMTRNKSGIYHFQADYPGISAAGIKNADFVSKKMNDNVVTLMRSKFNVLTVLAEGSQAKPKGIFSNDITYTVVKNSPSLFAVRFDSVQKNAGESSAKKYVFTLNMDSSGGHVIVLKDLFKSDADYLKALSDYVSPLVKSALAGPSEENFRNFIITGKSIIVYLNGGVDLSGAAAQIEIPFEKLSKVIDPNCPYVN